MCMPGSTSNDHSISNGETELETFQGDTYIANRKDQATEYKVEQLLLHFKSKVGQRRYGQAKKFEETTKVTCWWCRDADVLQSSRSRSVRAAATCVGMLRYSMTTTRKIKDLCSPRGAKKKVFLGTSPTVTLLEKRSRQECRTVLKLGRNTFGLSTHHSNVKKRIKKQK